jgi:hypothetical protein
MKKFAVGAKKTKKSAGITSNRLFLWQSIINYQLSIINYQLSIINYQLSIINYQLSIINYH